MQPTSTQHVGHKGLAFTVAGPNVGQFVDNQALAMLSWGFPCVVRTAIRMGHDLFCGAQREIQQHQPLLNQRRERDFVDHNQERKGPSWRQLYS